MYFLPDSTGVSKKKLFEVVEDAKKIIKVCVYTFTSKELAKLLVLKQSLGIMVQIITDKSQLKALDEQISFLLAVKQIFSRLFLQNGISVKVQRNIKHKIHHKFIVIDDSSWVMGSLNYSKASFQHNYENLLIGVNLPYEGGLMLGQRFDDLWNSPDLYPLKKSQTQDSEAVQEKKSTFSQNVQKGLLLSKRKQSENQPQRELQSENQPQRELEDIERAFESKYVQTNDVVVTEIRKKRIKKSLEKNKEKKLMNE